MNPIIKKIQFTIILGLCLLQQSVTAQENSTSFSLIRDIYSSWLNDRPYTYKDCETFYYTDRVDTAILEKIKATFQSDKEYKQWSPNATAYIKEKTRFTLEERKYLLAELELLKTNGWQPHMFPYAEMIQAEALNTLIEETDKSNTNPDKKICLEVYSFSRPIFLRNKTLCLFYSGKRNIFTSGGALWLYQKKEGEWSQLVCIYEWSGISM